MYYAKRYKNYDCKFSRMHMVSFIPSKKTGFCTIVNTSPLPDGGRTLHNCYIGNTANFAALPVPPYVQVQLHMIYTDCNHRTLFNVNKHAMTIFACYANVYGIKSYYSEMLDTSSQ